MIPPVAAAQAGGRKLIWPQRFLSWPREEERKQAACAQLAYLSSAQEDGKLQSGTPEVHLTGFQRQSAAERRLSSLRLCPSHHFCA